MKKLLFSAEGRIGRGAFWKGILVSVFGAMIVAAVLNFALARIIPNEAGPDGGFSVTGANAVPFLVLNLAATIFAVWSSICLGVKRYHDRNKPGVWVLLSIVPFANIWYFIETGFLKGTTGPNGFGPDPLAGAHGVPAGLSPAI